VFEEELAFLKQVNLAGVAGGFRAGHRGVFTGADPERQPHQASGISTVSTQPGFWEYQSFRRRHPARTSTTPNTCGRTSWLKRSTHRPCLSRTAMHLNPSHWTCTGRPGTGNGPYLGTAVGEFSLRSIPWTRIRKYQHTILIQTISVQGVGPHFLHFCEAWEGEIGGWRV